MELHNSTHDDKRLNASGNCLGTEKSPYLVRHAGNPVAWHPWSEAAFDKARQEDKPIFLSIGYASCHWCHVMERECFRDDELAALLNDACISVKVDREERPDIDALFMEICKIQNGSGGWPLNIFLTPDGEPFFAATWLPKRTLGKIPGLADIVPRVKWLWMMQREDVLKGAKSLVDTLIAKSSFAPEIKFGPSAARTLHKELKKSFDPEWGGFGSAPKFPSVPRMLFLIEYARTLNPSDREEVFSMLDLTLRKMWRGGIHDHLGGGFSRYTVDNRWIYPHFEKMLYDQALLLRAVTAMYEAKPDDFYKLFAEDVVSCVMRDFLSPESCFYSSIDADSEGEEGKYYLWTEEEIRSLLPPGDTGVFCAAYAILPGGNYQHEVTGIQTGLNILYEASPLSEVAKRYGLRMPELAAHLENDRRLLWEARNRRPAPALDDKVLMDWNGLMIGSLAYAGRVFEKKEWIAAAERAALFLQKTLADPKGNWRRRYRLKEAAIPALPADYAAFIWGVMELYESSASEKQKKEWLRLAETLAAKLEENYWDEDAGGFFLSRKDEPDLFFRRKSATDDILPSANAMAITAYVLLGRALDSKKYLGMAKAISACFARAANVAPDEHISLVTTSLLLDKIGERKPEL